MSPARKAKKTAKKAAKKAAPSKTSRKAAKPKAAKRAAPGKAPAKPQKAHCAATDPFGQPCQSIPRYGSAYCTIHSYLDR